MTLQLEGGDTFTMLNPDGVECTCQRRDCRCHCHRCGSRNLVWESWGSYLDKDLVCQNCKWTQSLWNC